MVLQENPSWHDSYRRLVDSQHSKAVLAIRIKEESDKDSALISVGDFREEPKEDAFFRTVEVYKTLLIDDVVYVLRSYQARFPESVNTVKEVITPRCFIIRVDFLLSDGECTGIELHPDFDPNRLATTACEAMAIEILNIMALSMTGAYDMLSSGYDTLGKSLEE